MIRVHSAVVVVSIGIVVTVAIVVACAVTASMAVTYDHFAVVMSLTTSYRLTVVVAANRIKCFHRDRPIIDGIRLNQCAHPVAITNVNSI